MIKLFRIFIVVMTSLSLVSCGEEEYSTKSTVYGVILDSVDNTPVEGAVVTNMTTGKNHITGSDGYYEFSNLQFNKTYKIYVEKDAYIPSTQSITPSELRDRIELNIRMSKRP